MDDQALGDIHAGTPKSDKIYLHEGVSSVGNCVQEIQGSMKILTEVDLNLAYSSEKLVNLHMLLMYLLAQENDLQAMALENNSISTDSIEKALMFDHLSALLDSEVREMDSFMDCLQAEMFGVSHKISLCTHLRELSTKMEEKLHDSEESLKHSQGQILGLKKQLAKFQRTMMAFKCENGKIDMASESSESSQLPNLNAKSNMQMAKQQRHLLRMLEKSFSRELDLEKKLAESRQSEEELKLKLHYTEQVAFHMEEAATVVWGRFLEAENAAEALMGISKDLIGQLQLVQFNLNGSIQRESEMQNKVKDCTEQLKEKDIALEKLERSNAEHIAQSTEAFALRGKVNFLEEILKKSQIQLADANACNDASQEQLTDIENIMDSLRESVFVAQSRAESAEAKATQLTETNLELTEELNFHKGSASNTEKKVGLLEKQVRKLEIQLQHAKASSEASQEQQNMLYSAIWDMETLIEDLKSKVSKAESKTETVQEQCVLLSETKGELKEQCVLLSETNGELNNEINLLRARIEFLETSLDQAKSATLESAKEINVRTKYIMDMAMQLATERERVEKQINTMTIEKNILVEKLGNTKIMYDNDDGDSKVFLLSNNGRINGTCAKTSKEAVPGSLDKSLQVDKLPEDAPIFESDAKYSSPSVNNADILSPKFEAVKLQEARRSNQNFIFVAIFVLLLSVLATYFFNQDFL